MSNTATAEDRERTTDLYRKCSVRDGKFVEPCETLQRAINGGNGYHMAGLQHVTWTDLTTLKRSRSFVVLRSGQYTKKGGHPGGMAINCCPFCGERIDAPFLEAEDDTAQSKDTTHAD